MQVLEIIRNFSSIKVIELITLKEREIKKEGLVCFIKRSLLSFRWRVEFICLAYKFEEDLKTFNGLFMELRVSLFGSKLLLKLHAYFFPMIVFRVLSNLVQRTNLFYA